MIKLAILLTLMTALLVAFTACDTNDDAITPRAQTAQPEPPLPTYEPILSQEWATLRFFYHSEELDPNSDLHPEAYLYITEDILIENLQEEFIRLMYEHIGVNISDLSFEETKLYVDLHEDAFRFFDGLGSTGGMMRVTIFEKTIASMPGIDSFEVLIDGQRGVMGNHFSFDQIIFVENGEIVGREYV